jgi:hypothetical protein
MKRIFLILVPLIFGFIIYIISPNSYFSKIKEDDAATRHIKSILKKNAKDPLNVAFENLLSKIPYEENTFNSMFVYFHDLWIKNNCNPKCNEEAVEERITFYNKQPIKHSLFNSIVFEKEILVPYTNESLKYCLENYCNKIVGTHDIRFELTFSEKIPQLSQSINEIILKNREPPFRYSISAGFHYGVDSNDEQSIEVFFDKIVTIKQIVGAYTHGAAHWYGGTYTTHFNIPKNRILKFNDVFKKNIIPKLSSLVFKRIEETYKDKTRVNLTNPIEETVSNITLWNFTNKGIYILLPPYEEGGWMETSRDFSYEEMDEFLTPFGKSLR